MLILQRHIMTTFRLIRARFTIFVKILYLFLLWRTERRIRPAGGSAFRSSASLQPASARRNFWVFAFVVLTLFAGEPANAARWHGISPLKSDKKSVRASLGKPSVETEDRMEFSRREGRVVIFFYTAGDTTELKLLPVLAGKVLSIYFYPKNPKEYDRDKLGALGRVGHGVTIEGEKMTSYDDGKRGISYHFVRDATTVWRIVYYAPASEFARYRLKESSG